MKSFKMKNAIAGSWPYIYCPPARDKLGQEVAKLMKHKYMKGFAMYFNISCLKNILIVGKFDGISQKLVEKGFIKIDLSNLRNGKIKFLREKEDNDELQENYDDGIL